MEALLSTGPPQVRDVLLGTSILDRVSAEAAIEPAGTEQVAGILSALVRANAFIQPIGSGWYRYHTLFAEVLRLKLRREHPDWIATLPCDGTCGAGCSVPVPGLGEADLRTPGRQVGVIVAVAGQLRRTRPLTVR